MVDGDGQEAARVIMNVEQRQLVVDVHRIREELDRQYEAPKRLGEKTSAPKRQNIQRFSDLAMGGHKAPLLGLFVGKRINPTRYHF